MEDVQSQTDHRNLDINKVGVRDLRYPIQIRSRDHELQHTIATLSMSVHLSQKFKGTHMSRFLEVLNTHKNAMTVDVVHDILNELCERLESQTAYVEMRFPFFIHKTAPVSHAQSLLDCEGYFSAHTHHNTQDHVIGIIVPVKSLCPCSKAISDYGAHNQRSNITIEVRPSKQSSTKHHITFEDLVDVAEASASAPLYPLLKRPDERHVTMQAYENPVFVEDIVRNVAHRLKSDDRIGWFKVMSVNQESIHNHNAFAEIEWTRPL